MRVKIRILGEAFAGQFAGPGAEFYDNRTGPARKKRNRFRQLEVLGYKVTLEAAAWPPFARRAAIRD
jgi:hypothetical protein